MPQIIAPDHGPIWREDLEKILGYYAQWAAQKPTRKAVVVYDTMWKSTEKMARAVVEGLLEGGATAQLMPLGSFHRSDVAGEILDAGALILGSSTLNNNMLPAMADVMTYLKGLKPANLVGATFGSFGWSGEATMHLTDILGAMGVEVIAEPLKVKFVPDDEALARCQSLGKEVAGHLKRD
jgi:flavorubredoxin